MASPVDSAHTPWRYSPLWLALLGIALAEVVGYFVIQSRVVDDDDWLAAAEVVRADYEAGDLIIVAPQWADPLLRRELGDLILLEDAGRADLAPYSRLWVLSIRGHRPAEAPDRAPEFEQLVGPVRVMRWDLGPSRVRYDFTRHVPEADVTIRQGSRDVACPFRTGGRPAGGGLGAGPVTPSARHQCDPRRGWLWVGTTMQDDLELRPRYCIWQHPAGLEPIRATFRDVPLADHLVFYGDLYYEHERDQEHGEVEISIEVDGREIAHMTHRDGDGWKRLEARTAELGETGDVTVSVTAESPDLRSFCWAASTRTAAGAAAAEASSEVEP